MRYCMHFYLKWHRNYAWSKLELRYLLNKKQTSNFDHAQFLHQLRQKFIQYLILKLQSIVKKGGKGQRMFAFLCSKIALCIWDFQYIKWGLSILICTPLYIKIQGFSNTAWKSPPCPFEFTRKNLLRQFCLAPPRRAEDILL